MSLLDDVRIHKTLLYTTMILLGVIIALSVLLAVFSGLLLVKSTDYTGVQSKAVLSDSLTILSLAFSLSVLALGVTSFVHSYIDVGVLPNMVMMFTAYAGLVVVVSLRGLIDELILTYKADLFRYTMLGFQSQSVILAVSMFATLLGVLLATYGFVKMVYDVGGGG